jgi:hypothetical protein
MKKIEEKKVLSDAEKYKIWYQKNRRRKIKYTMDYHKRTGYAAEKTEKQRKNRSIKRSTRYFFPLKNKICKVCGNPATEHHHITNPIQFDKFDYVCHKHHLELQYLYHKI